MSAPAPSLFATLDPTRETWGLGPLPPAHGALLLIGWSRVMAYSDDDDAPAVFASILADALVCLGPVAFPTTELQAGAAGAAGNAARFAPWAPRRGARASRARSALCVTGAAALAVHLFNDAAYQWVLQSQFGLVCADGVAPAALVAQGRALEELIEPGWSKELPTLAQAGVRAVLRPGVDGDVAGLLAADAPLRQRVIEAIAQSARQAGVAFDMLNEAGFLKALAA